MMGSLVRACLVAILVAIPSLLLPHVSQNNAQMVTLICLFAASLTYVEYRATYPSFLEFRDAAPFNRLRYVGLLIGLLVVCIVIKEIKQGQGFVFGGAGLFVASAMDFPFSPVTHMQNAVQVIAPWISPVLLTALCGAAFVTMILLVVTLPMLAVMNNWPNVEGGFNVWTNLPLFDPTAGGDVLKRLRRDGYFNLVLGILMPFLVPGAIKLLSFDFVGLELSHFHTLVWIFAAWVFLPLSLIMRGLGVLRVAFLVQEQRRRTYAQSDLQLA